MSMGGGNGGACSTVGVERRTRGSSPALPAGAPTDAAGGPVTGLATELGRAARGGDTGAAVQCRLARALPAAGDLARIDRMLARGLLQGIDALGFWSTARRPANWLARRRRACALAHRSVLSG